MIGDPAAVVAAILAVSAAVSASALPCTLWWGVALAGAASLSASRIALVGRGVGRSSAGLFRQRMGTAVASRSLRGPGCAPPAHSGAGLRFVSGGAVLVVAGLSGLRAEVDLAGLARPLPARLDTVAELGEDPVVETFGTRVLLVADGRRWTSTVPRELEWALEGRRMGDRIHIRAHPRPLLGAPAGWVRSEHLAGRLQVSEIRPAGSARPWFAQANALLERLERGAGSFDHDSRSLFLGLVVGDDRGQSDLTRHRFRVAGLTHLLAVSGQNVAFLLAVLAPMSSRLAFRWRTALGVAALAGFVVLTRAEPSVLRAATMAGVALWASASGRSVRPLRVMAVAVVALLLADPLLVHAIGFRLSIGATLGLVLLTRPLQARLPGPPWLTLPLAVTLAAQAGAMPVMAATFGASSVLAVPANLLAEPAAGLVMMAGLTVGLVAGVVREDIAAVLQAPVRVLVWWIDTVAREASQLSVPPLGPQGWLALVAGGAVGVLLWRRHGARAVGRAFVVSLLPLMVLTRPPGPFPQAVELAGGAVLIDGCAGRVVVLEKGARLGEEVLQALSELGVARVELLVSPESDAGVTDVALQLRADVGPATEGVLTPRARGSPCRFAS